MARAPTPPKADLAQEFLNAVHSALGDTYEYGADAPPDFDCSGLVYWAARKAGISGMPRTSEAQSAFCHKITKGQLKPSDLVFLQFPGDNASPGHVETYIGGGKMIGADDPAEGVRIDTLSSVQGSIVGYGRIPGLNGSATEPGGGSGGGGGGLLSLFLPDDVLGLFSAAEDFTQKLLWIINPENWARIIAGVFGFFLLAFGIGFLIIAAA